MESDCSSWNYKLIVAYDGSNYHGWQKTKMGPSIEETLEQVIQSPLQAASRTDAGVHAEGQVVNFFSPKEFDLNEINTLLPSDISINSVEKVSENFHPTVDCTKKEYHYFICTGNTQLPQYRNTSWHHPTPLSLEAMLAAAKALEGTYDYSAFCNVQENETHGDNIRTVEQIAITPLPGGRFQFRVIGNHFLYKMVRNLVGTLVQVGAGRISFGEVSAILASKDRKQAGITAPAHGLSLHKVHF